MIDDIIENLFDSDEQMDILNNLVKLNVEYLQQLGTVTEEQIEENGLIQETITFNSFDGKYNYVQTNSYFSANKKHEQVKKLNQKIENAVAAENYMLAADLKHQKDEILHTV